MNHQEYLWLLMVSLDNGMDWDVSYTESTHSSYLFQPDTSTSRFDAAIKGSWWCFKW